MKRTLRRLVAWIAAIATGILLYASFTGNAEGAFGLGILSAPIWPWLVLLAAGAIAASLLVNDSAKKGSVRT